MSFTHLHVASGFSLRHGADTPHAIVAAALAHGMPAIALTDRDSMAGAVRFVAAARDAGVGAIVGVDVPIASGAQVAARTPARGGLVRDPGLHRIVALAEGGLLSAVSHRLCTNLVLRLVLRMMLFDVSMNRSPMVASRCCLVRSQMLERR